MSLYSVITGWLSPSAKSAHAKLDGPRSGWNWGEGPTFANKRVTPDTAMSLSAVWACVRLNARTIGSLPLKLYERNSTLVRTAAEGHPLARVLGSSPNPDQTAMEFWEGQVTALNLRGNAYARIGRRGDGNVVALWPLSPDSVSVFRSPTGERRYKVTSGSGTEDLSANDVFHLRGFGAGGDQGLSPIQYGRQTIATALAAEEVAGATFANGLQLAGFVEMATGTKLTTEQRTDLASLFEKFAGSSKAGKVMPLDAGMKFTALGITPEDAQLLATRGFSVEEICRWFGPFPVLIGHAAQGQTMWGTGVEAQILAWKTLGYGPELTRIEQAIGRQLLLPRDQGKFYAEFIDEGLMRADSAGRAALYASAGQNGWMSRDEIRAKENLPPASGGQKLTVQSNLIPLDMLGTIPPRPVQPAPGEPI